MTHSCRNCHPFSESVLAITPISAKNQGEPVLTRALYRNLEMTMTAMKNEVLLYNYVTNAFIQSQRGLFIDLYLPERRLAFRKATFSRLHATKQYEEEFYSKAVLLQSQPFHPVCLWESHMPKPASKKDKLFDESCGCLLIYSPSNYSLQHIQSERGSRVTTVTKKRPTRSQTSWTECGWAGPCRRYS